MSRVSSVFCLVLLASSSPLAAQGGGHLVVPGARLRLWPAGGGRPTIGILRSLDSTAVTVTASGGDLLLPRASLVRVDVSRGVHSNAMRGLELGALIGGTTGAVLGLAAGAGSQDQDVNAAEFGVAGAGVGGLAGGLIGLGIGAFSHSERWRKVRPDESRLALHVTPAPGGAAVAIGMRF